jgi:transcription antitermination factor NusG
MAQQPQWAILARTQAGREMWAAENIVRQGYGFYLPKLYEQRRIKGRRYELIAVPMFPTYIFVFAEAWYWLFGTWGVKSVVMRGSEPDRIPLRELDRMRSLESKGVVRLPRAPKSLYDVGDKVSVRTGAFRDHEGVVQGMDSRQRVQVLFDFLGGKVKMLVSAGSLVPV